MQPTSNQPLMGWFSWLSKTSLEPSLVYEYGLAFSRNELQLEDANYFNHEFLQSMGISIAKHRLEILKLAKKEVQPNLSVSGVIKKCLRKCLKKISFREVKEITPMPLPPQEPKWKRALVSRYLKGEEKGMHKSRNTAKSGPLDGRFMHEEMMGNKVFKFSGPLDERMVCTNITSPMVTRPIKSPRFSGQLNNRSPTRLTRPLDEWTESPMGYQSPYHNTRADSDYHHSSLWSTHFEYLKPT